MTFFGKKTAKKQTVKDLTKKAIFKSEFCLRFPEEANFHF